MSFRNEFVSADDILSYGLDEIYRSFSPMSWRSGRPQTFQHSWTIDRDRNSFLLLLGRIQELGPSGRLEPTSRHVFHLQIRDCRARIILDPSRDSSRSFSEHPYRVIWDLIGLEFIDGVEASHPEVIAMLREALEVYGLDGVYRQVPGTKVHLRIGAQT